MSVSQEEVRELCVRISRIATKLKHLQELDKDYEVVGAASHQYKFKKVSEEDIAEFEKRHNIRFPMGYRLLIQFIGINAGPFSGLMSFEAMTNWCNNLTNAVCTYSQTHSGVTVDEKEADKRVNSAYTKFDENFVFAKEDLLRAKKQKKQIYIFYQEDADDESSDSDVEEEDSFEVRNEKGRIKLPPKDEIVLKYGLVKGFVPIATIGGSYLACLILKSEDKSLVGQVFIMNHTTFNIKIKKGFLDWYEKQWLDKCIESLEDGEAQSDED